MVSYSRERFNLGASVPNLGGEWERAEKAPMGRTNKFL